MIKHIFYCNGTLHLVLKAKWYDLIKSGIKKEEYRELTEYWARRLLFFPYTIGRSMPRNFISVCFHRGYTNEKSYYALDDIRATRECFWEMLRLDISDFFKSDIIEITGLKL